MTKNTPQEKPRAIRVRNGPEQTETSVICPICGLLMQAHDLSLIEKYGSQFACIQAQKNKLTFLWKEMGAVQLAYASELRWHEHFEYLYNWAEDEKEELRDKLDYYEDDSSNYLIAEIFKAVANEQVRYAIALCAKLNEDSRKEARRRLKDLQGILPMPRPHNP